MVSILLERIASGLAARGITDTVIAGRSRDMEDARLILLKHPACDRAYILRWLKEFDASLDGGFTARFEGIAGT